MPTFGTRVEAAAVSTLTVPGLRFLHDGQLEGRRRHLPVQLGRAADEPIDEALRAFYERLLAAVGSPVFREGDWRLLDIAPAGDESWTNLAAWQWRNGHSLWVVAVNPGHAAAQGHVRVNDELPDRDRHLFEDVLDGREYPWERQALQDSGGLYIRLDGGAAHVFRVR